MNNGYFYGASVQGIQSFIFETNKLREIAGASELVEQICTSLFEEVVGPSFEKERLIVGAAGNIKYVFSQQEICTRVVRIFPKVVTEKAPGIQLSQAVVETGDDFEDDYERHVTILEQRLRAQRNKAMAQQGLGWMISERSRRTGKAAISGKIPDLLDASQSMKRDNASESSDSLLKKLIPQIRKEEKPRQFPVEMNRIASQTGGSKSWIAVIHADGNDLGKKIRALSESHATPEQFRQLSLRLDKATRAAAAFAFEKVVETAEGSEEFYPFRPIILGGDDLTVIIRGDLAIRFTEVFLSAFERETKAQFSQFSDSFSQGLTACAGIAFIKPTYPFHYGIHLAEALCSQAKKVAKDFLDERTPSCLLFHKVHSSFIEDYKSIIQQELTAGEKRLDYGPYFLSPQKDYATISDLMGWVTALNKKGSPKSRLRNWLTDLQGNQAAATQQLDRIKQITENFFCERLDLDSVFTTRKDEKEDKKTVHTHLFDAITISTINSTTE